MTILPKISVVVPSYNQNRFLHQCLDSIVEQGYPDLELIVMDGGSTDGSVETIHSYQAHISYWQSQPDGGQSAAINAGVARATGELVGWLNSDDLYWGDALWIVGRAWRRNPGRGLYIGNGFRLDEATKVLTRHNRRHMAMSRRALAEGLDYIQQPSGFFNLQEWQAFGGLDERLNYCMDWDIFLRIAARRPVVLINEFLSVSREYQDTKSASGGLERCAELLRLVKAHTGKEMTIGGAVYLTETILGPQLAAEMSQAFRDDIYRAQNEARGRLSELGALGDGSPDVSDEGDITDVPLPEPSRPPLYDQALSWPRITVITPSYNQAEFLERTLRSIIDQGYPNIEMIVMDGGSSDNSVEIIQKYEHHLAHWVSQKDNGPAQAINEGIARATGEVLIWLNSDDMFADGALHLVGRAFGDDEDLDMIYGDALYVDANDRPIVMDHGEYKTSQYFGKMVPRDQVPAYWSYVHAVPQPATYFRRRLIQRSGSLDESYKFIFDFELFFRLMHESKIRKVDRILAFYRIHASAKTSGWSDFLIELYRFSRQWWPSRGEPAFATTRADFLAAFMNRYWGGRKRGRLFRMYRAFFSAVVTYQWRNPEEMLAKRDRKRTALEAPAAQSTIPPLVLDVETQERPHPLARRPIRYTVIFCGLFLPRFPGMSGGEIRDFHLIRGLLEFCGVTVVTLHDFPETSEQRDYITAELDDFYDPARIRATTPGLIRERALERISTRSWRKMDQLRLEGWPVVGQRLPRDVELSAAHFEGRVGDALSALLAQGPDFLFISPQTNPAANFQRKQFLKTRFIFATYDVESVRLERLGRKTKGLKRLGSHLETLRGTRFERDYVRMFDGIIAVSELDKSIFVENYGIAPERVTVIDNGVDVNYFAFTERSSEGPPIILYPASFGYPPNRLAAARLVERIMPLLWEKHEDAQLWLVGQAPTPEILAMADGTRIFVTGRVDSVLPYFTRASFMCAPLELGSGTKTKVIEAMSAGLPVVCTALAAEGLNVVDGVHVAVRDDDAGMVAEMVRLLADPAAMKAMAAAGRQVAADEYSWDSVLPKLEPWLDTLSGLPRIASEWEWPSLTIGTTSVSDERFLVTRGVGWSDTEGTHIWSIGQRSELSLRCDTRARKLRLVISGNPHVKGRVQQLQVSLNDRPFARQEVHADSRSMVEFDCADGGWLPDQANRIVLELDATSRTDLDTRDLGLCLWQVEVEEAFSATEA